MTATTASVPDSPLYEALATELAGAIAQGVYAAGERMPSIRTMSRRHRVSRATVIQAYMRLEDEGLIYARERSGHFVSERVQALPRVRPRLVRPVEPSIGRLSMELMEDFDDSALVNFGCAFPEADVLPLQKLAAITARLAHQREDLPADYGRLGGLTELRVQLARRAAAAGFACAPGEITVTNGGMEALTLALRAVAGPGEVIAVESPTYFGVLQAAESLGIRIVEVATDPRGGVELEALAVLLGRVSLKAFVCMPGLHNPLACTMPEEKRRRLVALLEAAGVALVEDDVYGDLSFSQPRPRAAKAFDGAGNVIYCSSFSKTVGPGYRLGWMAAGRYAERVHYLKFLSTLTSATLPQLVLAEFLRQGGYEKVTRYAASVYQRRLQQARRWVLEYFPPGTAVAQPEGGYFLWIALPAGVDAMALHQRALAGGIRVMPGTLFSPNNLYANYIRISCAKVYGEPARRALQTLGQLVGAAARAA